MLKFLDDDCELEEIVAGCKNNILKLHREFDWSTYNKKQVLFFVDKDLSFWLNESSEYDENVFITDEYSVENYVVNSQGFKHWLLRFEGFSRATKQEIEKLLSEFVELELHFRELMKPIMAMAVVAKRIDKNVVLSNYKISKYLKFSIQNGQVICKLDKYDNKLYDKWKIEDKHKEKIERQIEYFSIENSQYSVRGKWLLFFMASLGEFMRIHPHYFAPSLNKTDKICPTCAVPVTQCFTALAPHCSSKVPDSLSKFLENTYSVYFKKAS